MPTGLTPAEPLTETSPTLTNTTRSAFSVVQLKIASSPGLATVVLFEVNERMRTCLRTETITLAVTEPLLLLAVNT